MLRWAVWTPVAAGIVAGSASLAVAGPPQTGPRYQAVGLSRAKLRLVGRGRNAAGQRLDAPSKSGVRGGRVFSTGTLEVEPFSLAALTWPAGAESPSATMLIRTRTRRGWSNWFELEDDGHGPDPGGAEANRARRGTDPVLVELSDAVEVKLYTSDGVRPSGLRLDLVSPGTDPTDSLAAAYGRFTIRTRADWGADESLREQTEPSYGEVSGMFVHHTAGSNSYDEAGVPAIIRSIYVYHVTGRGWRDIGYNFLIDKFGRIWEGRYGGMTRAVVGAHTLGYNSFAFGAAVLGTYTSKSPEPEVLGAYENLIAWKFALHDVDPRATVAYPGLATLPAISGHRDGVATECPGDELYGELSTIRQGVTPALMSCMLSQNRQPCLPHEYDPALAESRRSN
jgi:hypothetical protein